jgi:hypothetical protein
LTSSKRAHASLQLRNTVLETLVRAGFATPDTHVVISGLSNQV